MLVPVLGRAGKRGPGLWFGDKAATGRLARACNEYGAKLVQDHPTRFGLFAAMPLPDVDATLREIEYAFDTLKADGVGTMTSYGDKWLGYPQLAPVWEELNRRKATVYTHPTGANCCVSLVQGIGESTVEFGAYEPFEPCAGEPELRGADLISTRSSGGR